MNRADSADAAKLRADAADDATRIRSQARQETKQANSDSERIRSEAAKDAEKIRADAQQQAEQQARIQTQRLRKQQEQLDKQQREWEAKREQRRQELQNMQPPIIMDMRFMLGSLHAFQRVVNGVKNPRYEKADSIAEEFGKGIGQLMADAFLQQNNEIFSKALSEELNSYAAKDVAERKQRTARIMANAEPGPTSYRDYGLGLG